MYGKQPNRKRKKFRKSRPKRQKYTGMKFAAMTAGRKRSHNGGKMARKSQGFSIIELMITIAVIAVLVSIATPNAIQWIRTAQFNSSVRNVKSKIEGARIFAVKSNARVEITFTGNAYQIDQLNRVTGVSDIQTHNLKPGISASFNNSPLRYDNRGMAAIAAGTIQIQSSSGMCREIVVAPEGNSRIEGCP
ncbi:type IV fimbrial biogenesis protein FimT [Desulfosalsimonas propionicica]|uniref:Type IV fimbrial biogenesis protein FimT n=1 Tax=Desulfosalsimonas propionicica TaxID=332175 RepID=A0A7W0HK04_9BACT|nr:prepilin-type N-terminal cleavage/methylation domain-containing protein [Desulfosalsimonas propionicica]MBA2880638.1 type IV fimbrial biogenesis protein FimT [Desulfosalsimonas propionicica]